MDTLSIERKPLARLNLDSFHKQPPIQLLSDPLLKRQEQRESNARSYPRRIPLALKQASGIYVKDTHGQIFMDCLAGAGTLALGHNHPVIVEALREVLDSGLPLHTLDLTTPVKDQFVEDIFAVLPEAFAKRARIQFCGPTGADAVEAAIKLVKTATGRRGMIGFSGGYHGMTHGALALMGNLGPKKAIANLMADVHFFPYPYDYRCPFGLGGEAGIDASLHYIERLLDDPESGVLPPAGIILEIIQGEGGVLPAPIRWLQGLRKITQKHQIPLIFDEVQTGIGRTGHMFAFQHAGILPDVLVLSKAIGGGLPMAVMLYDEDLDEWSPGAHAGTFRGNQMAMAAGSATLNYILDYDLPQHAEKMGSRLDEHLQLLKTKHAFIGDIRGRGLMMGVEIVDPTAEPDHLGSYPANPLLARVIQQHALRQGLIVELGGRHGAVVRFLPPLIIQKDEIDTVAQRFAQALEMALQK